MFLQQVQAIYKLLQVTDPYLVGLSVKWLPDMLGIFDEGNAGNLLRVVDANILLVYGWEVVGVGSNELIARLQKLDGISSSQISGIVLQHQRHGTIVGDSYEINGVSRPMRLL